ncbi:MAG: response regulator transcription factor [Euryarchaeota archaeon]|nr:response regulator transcription factor [Euryarchaeota archaeon]
MKVIAGVDDIMFTSKIQIAARASGQEVEFATNRETLLGAASDGGLVLLDLDAPAFDPLNLIPELTARESCRVIAFVSHVEADVARRAREAGAHQVLSRSRFFEALPGILRP